MHCLFVGEDRLEAHEPRDLKALVGRASGFAWVDIAELDAEGRELLTDALGLRADDLDAVTERSLLPILHHRPAYTLLILQLLDSSGRLFQIGMFVGDRYLVSVHGPRPGTYEVDVGEAITAELRGRLESGGDHPIRPVELAALVFGELADSLETYLGDAARAGGMLDRKMREKAAGDPEVFLEEAFKVRHDLVTIGSRLSQSREVCANLATGEMAGADVFDHLQTRFGRLRTVCDGEKEFLQGMLDYYESLTNTKMNIAMERLAVIAAVALPITAIGGVLGMNTIVSAETSWVWTAVTLIVMGVFGFVMLRWAKKHGWW